MIRLHSNQKEHLWLWFVRRLPRRLRYWVVLQAGVEATTGRFRNTPAPELTFFEVLKEAGDGD